ncbi:hypothetical protein ACFLZ6_02210, partial [Nanoarchaeota archaeon]
GSCSAGDCIYSTLEENSTTCGWTEPGCTSNSDCTDTEYCAKADSDCSGNGICQETPTFCMFSIEPVCGCDGSTYDNWCLAAWNKINVDYEGACIEPACSSDSECGTDGFMNNPVCFSGDVFDDYRTYLCSNPGELSASCSFSDINQKKETCEFGCTDGECDSDPCLGVNCDDYCDPFYTYYYNGACSEGSCSYTIEQNSNSCGYTEPVCDSDSDCGTDGFMNNPVCFSGDVFDDYRTYLCSNPGELSASCSFSDINQKKETCEFGCTDGECASDPCSDITCDNYCDDYTYYSAGTCSDGTCSYSSIEQNSADCGYTEPECYSNSDCGTNAWLNNLFCKHDDVWGIYLSYTCNNPGTASASCSVTDDEQKKENCPDTCSNGECIDLTCRYNHECASDEYCAKDTADCKGVGECKKAPTACPLLMDPVCGCDGNTYPNKCTARWNKVNIVNKGQCARSTRPQYPSPIVGLR